MATTAGSLPPPGGFFIRGLDEEPARDALQSKVAIAAYAHIRFATVEE